MSTPLDAHARQDGSRLTLAWVAVAAIIILAFYPGVMSNDSIAALKQARSFEFTSWHPPIMALVWSPLDRLVEGPALMLVAQAILYSIACARLCAEGWPALMARVSPWIVVPAYALFPPVMALNGMIWKDVWMSTFLLLALVKLFQLQRDRGSSRKWRTFAILAAYCLLATAFRHNAVAATAGLLAGGGYFLMPARVPVYPRLLAACVGGVLLAVALMLLVSMSNRLVAKPAHVTTPILLHDIAGMIMKSGEPRAAARHALSLEASLSDTDQRTFLKRIKRGYDPAAAAKLIRTRRKPDTPFAINVYELDHDAASVKRAWRGMVERYPGAYLRHRGHAFACLLQLCGTSQWAFHSYVLNPRYVGSDQGNIAQRFLRKTLVSPSLTRLYSPLLWLAIALLAGVYGLARIRSRHAILLFTGLSAMGLAVSLFFTSPIESYRYMHWVILVGWASVWLGLEAWVARGPRIAREPA